MQKPHRTVLGSLVIVAIVAMFITADTMQADEPRVAPAIKAPGTPAAPVASDKTLNNGAEKTADWHKDPLCRQVFHVVLRGLYEDGVPSEVVDLIVGSVKENRLKKNFVFRCKLCHACYEAFAVYQRRPAFSGTGDEVVSAFGDKPIDAKVMADLRSGHPRTTSKAMGTILQPYIKQMILEMKLENDAEKIKVIQRFAELAKEGNALIQGYTTCQACDAIEEVAKTMKPKDKNVTIPTDRK